MERKPTLTTIAIDKLHPHPDNPRKVLGDIDELAESITLHRISHAEIRNACNRKYGAKRPNC